jgi:group I intron endonuclease
MSIYTNPIINDTICSIYVITCLINNKKYIGFTKRSINVRWHEHIRYSKTDNNSALYRAMRKHGINNFSIQAIYQSKNIEHTYKVMEPYFITEYKTHVRYNQGYNSVDGGIGCANPSAKTRYKMGSANRGKKRVISKQACLSYTKHTGDFISPNGEIVVVNNFEQFAREHNLTVRMLIRVNNGIMENHRGWRSSNYKITTKKTFHPIRKYSITSPDGAEYVIDNYNLSGFCKFYSLGLSSIYKLIDKKIKSHHGWTLSNNSFSTNA